MGCRGCGHSKLSHRLKANGDLHFVRKGPEPPPGMKGYERDSGDDWLFHPKSVSYLPCGSAIAFQVKDENGQNVMGRMCTHPEVSSVTVGVDQCQGCPLRGNVELSEQSPVKIRRSKTILQRIMSHIIDYA